MTALEQHRYGDPLKVLLRQEEQSCKGCKSEFKAEGFGMVMWVCTKPDKAGKRRQHGKRCKDYSDRNNK